MKTGSTPVKTIKLFLLGDPAKGKTTLKKSLSSVCVMYFCIIIVWVNAVVVVGLMVVRVVVKLVGLYTYLLLMREMVKKISTRSDWRPWTYYLMDNGTNGTKASSHPAAIFLTISQIKSYRNGKPKFAILVANTISVLVRAHTAILSIDRIQIILLHTCTVLNTSKNKKTNKQTKTKTKQNQNKTKNKNKTNKQKNERRHLYEDLVIVR